MVDSVGGLVAGDEVIIVANTPNVIAGAKSSLLHIGRVFEIYTKNTNSTSKDVAEINDLVILETDGA